MLYVIIAIVAIFVIILLAYIHMKNSMIRLHTDVDNAWSQIDVQFQRRNDLIPNLVSTVKGYAHYEQNTLENVIKQRSQMINLSPKTDGKTGSRQQLMDLSNQITSSLKSIFAVSERYPDLKANSDFQQLMEELENTENKVAFARQNYNNTVATYNQAIQVFPQSIVANQNHYTKVNYLQTPTEDKKVPKVNFNN